MTPAFAHPFMSGLFADPEMSAHWSADTQLAHYIAFEAAWSRAGHIADLWPQEEGQNTAVAIEAVALLSNDLKAGTGQDGVPIPSLVRILKEKTGSTAIHKGATSQDVMDTSLALSMTSSLNLISNRLSSVLEAGERCSKIHGAQRLVGRTRMQNALAISVQHRVQSWIDPIRAHHGSISDLQRSVAKIQVGGPVGDRRGLGDKTDEFVRAVAEELALTSAPSWHTQREGVAAFADFLSRVTGSLGKIGQDIALMAQMGEMRMSSGGGSSAMPHKQNPIFAELLVTLARFNATQLSGVHQAMVHEQERSGSAWSLEWMILPQMAEATGRALNAMHELFQQIVDIGEPD